MKPSLRGFYFRAPMFPRSQRGSSRDLSPTDGLLPFSAMSGKLQYCVYVLLSHKDGKLYIGFSTDLKQRLTAHFNGHVEATSHRRPLELIYCEYHKARSDALRREGYFKTTMGKKALRLMLREGLALK
ncbi:MAG: GIY-YIG nuclease family protein [Phycisphaerae bacterium]|nr:GIY-YIG nuclease family protein [Phycisphaerae bacterium]